MSRARDGPSVRPPGLPVGGVMSELCLVEEQRAPQPPHALHFGISGALGRRPSPLSRCRLSSLRATRPRASPLTGAAFIASAQAGDTFSRYRRRFVNMPGGRRHAAIALATYFTGMPPGRRRLHCSSPVTLAFAASSGIYELSVAAITSPRGSILGAARPLYRVDIKMKAPSNSRCHSRTSEYESIRAFVS